jgi:hypothetical protein
MSETGTPATGTFEVYTVATLTRRYVVSADDEAAARAKVAPGGPELGEGDTCIEVGTDDEEIVSVSPSPIHRA